MAVFKNIIFLCLLLEISYGKKIPDFIQRCKYTEDKVELGKCLKKSFEDNKEKFMAGVPEMHIPQLDPFYVPRIDFSTGNGSVIGLNAVFLNVNIEGARNAVIDKVEADVLNGKSMIEVSIPFLSIIGEYQLDGRILIMQLNGSGKGEGNFTDLHAITHYDGKFVTRNNKEYIEWSNPKLELSVGGTSMYFHNLFNGNDELTKSTNDAINDSSEEILKEMKPLVEETIASIVFSIMQQVFHTYSIDELFEK